MEKTSIHTNVIGNLSSNSYPELKVLAVTMSVFNSLSE